MAIITDALKSVAKDKMAAAIKPAAASSESPLSGLAETTKKSAASTKKKGYNPLERAILGQEGIKASGIFAKKEVDGKKINVTKKETDSALKGSVFTFIIKRLDNLEKISAKESTVSVIHKAVGIIDLKVTNVLKYLGSIESTLKKSIEDQKLREAESGLETKAPDKKDVTKVSPKMKSFLDTFALMLIPLALALLSKIRGAWTWIGAGINTVVGKLGKIGKLLQEGLGKTLNGLKSIVEGVISKVKGFGEAIAQKLGFGKKAGAAVEEAGKLGKAAGKAGKAAAAGEGIAIAAGEQVGKVGKLGQLAKGVAKLSGKAAKALGYLVPFRNVLSKIPLLAKLLMFIDPVIATIKAASGEGSWTEVKKAFAKSLGSFLGGEGGFILGAAIGTAIFPGFGTIIGGVIGAFGGAMAGEYLGLKIAEIVFDGKSVSAVLKEISDDLVKKVKETASKIGKSIKSFFGFGGEDKAAPAAATPVSKPTPTAAGAPAAKTAAKTAAGGVAATSKGAVGSGGKFAGAGASGTFTTPAAPEGSDAASSTGAKGAKGAKDAGGNATGVKPDVLSKKAQLEKAVGKSLIITSGYRPGVANHGTGDAIDLGLNSNQLNESERNKIFSTAIGLGFTGLGAEYSAPGGAHIHLDTSHKSLTGWGSDYHSSSLSKDSPYLASLIASKKGTKTMASAAPSSGASPAPARASAAPSSGASPAPARASAAPSSGASPAPSSGASPAPAPPRTGGAPAPSQMMASTGSSSKSAGGGKQGQQYGVPSPSAPHSQEDHIAAYFNVGDPPMGVGAPAV